MSEDAQTFLFADLAGFTALTEAHGDEDAADLVDDFCHRVREALSDYGAREVKALGDALMLVVPDAALAVRLGVHLAYEVGDSHGLPSVRVGMHTGPAVERNGDWFGATVNIAARVSSLAGGGEVLITEATKDAIGGVEDLHLRSRGRHEMKNVHRPLSLYEAAHADRDRDRLPIDPVCRMAVDPAHEAGSLRHRGTEYHFCSLECAAAFSADPDRFAAA